MPERPTLKQAIGRSGFFALAFGSMIGVGWITGLKDLFTQAGPVGTILAFAAGGMLMFAIGRCYAYAMELMPVTGGEVAYAYRAYGPGKAFMVGWFLAIGYLSVSAFEAVSVGIVVSYLINVDAWPLYELNGSPVYGSHVLIALACTLVIATVNYRGVDVATNLQSALTLVLVVLTVMFVSAGIRNGSTANMEPYFGDPSEFTIFGGILAVFVTVPFWFVGFDTIPQAAEERVAGFAPRQLGTVLGWSIIGATLFYVLVFLSVGMVTPWQTIIDDPLPTAAAFRATFTSSGGQIVLLVGLIGLLTSWNGFFLSGCRVIFAMGRGQIIPQTFGTAHLRFGTPTAAIVFSTLVTATGALLGRQSVLVFVNVGSLCISFAFLGVAFSLQKIWRESEDEFPEPSKRIMPWIAGLGSLFLIASMVTPGSPAALSSGLEWTLLGVLMICGAAFWFLAKTQSTRLDPKERDRLILGETVDRHGN